MNDDDAMSVTTENDAFEQTETMRQRNNKYIQSKINKKSIKNENSNQQLPSSVLTFW